MTPPRETPEGHPDASFLVELADMTWWRLPGGSFLITTDGNYFHTYVSPEEAKELSEVLRFSLT